MVMLDPAKGGQVFISGKKGSGKSVMARRLFDTYPYDRIVLDVTGDLSRDFKRDGIKFTRLDPHALPLRFPSGGDDGPVTLVLVPDMGDEDEAVAQMDRCIGLAMTHRRTLVWSDETGVLSRAGRTPPNLRRALHHGRHSQLFLMLAGPRAMAVDPLCISQADVVMTFKTPSPADRKRIADNIGWPPQRFDAAVHALGQYEYLMYDSNGQDDELLHMPPLPRSDDYDLTA